MTPRIVGGIAAATFAIGILTGAAGTIVARDASTPQANFAADMADHMGTGSTASMMGTGMGSMMSGSMMGPTSSVPDMDGMMSGSMMVPSGPGTMSPGSSLSPDASPMPGGLHDSHHPTASPDGAK
jgi:hypothetical protein